MYDKIIPKEHFFKKIEGISHTYVEGSYNKYYYTEEDFTIQNNGQGNANGGYGDKYQSSDYRDKITSIDFLNTIDFDIAMIDIWNLSKTLTGAVIGYITEDKNNEGMYKLYIATNNDKIYFPENSDRLLARMNNVTNINNINIVDTSRVKTFIETFRYMEKLESIDLSNFNTINVTNMQHMFSNMNQIKEIDLSNLNLKNVTNMVQMFSTTSVEKINFSSAIIQNIENMSGMFLGAYNLKELDISSFDFSNIKNYKQFFLFAENVDRTIYVKDVYAKEIVQALSPNATIIVKT